MGELFAFPQISQGTTCQKPTCELVTGYDPFPESNQNEAERRRNPLFYDKVTGEYLDAGLMEIAFMVAMGIHNHKLPPQVIAVVIKVREYIHEQIKGLNPNKVIKT